MCCFPERNGCGGSAPEGSRRNGYAVSGGYLDRCREDLVEAVASRCPLRLCMSEFFLRWNPAHCCRSVTRIVVKRSRKEPSRASAHISSKIPSCDEVKPK